MSVFAAAQPDGLSRREQVAGGSLSRERTVAAELRASGICYLLREDPELADAVSAEQRPAAIEACTARTIRLPRGAWSGPSGRIVDGGIGLLVLEGVLVRRLLVGGRASAELLGPGDLLHPSPDLAGPALLSASTSWQVLAPARLAALDRRVEQRLARYPELTARLVGRALERCQRQLVNLAIIHQARVELRLQMLFWHLADRFGRVRPDGVHVPLRLTHAVLADLVAAQRPSVTSALGDLARRGTVRQLADGWLLAPNAGAEEAELSELLRAA
jgi:CRP/FNR family cyclic AMP-dependent transcriptional regulator